MKSQQINFFMNPNEYDQLTKLVHNLDFLILSSESATTTPCVLQELKEPFGLKYLVLSTQIPLLSLSKINDRFVIDSIDSPVISFTQNYIHNKEINRGRFYFSKDNWAMLMKNELFIKKAQQLFKEFKKTFPNAATEEYKYFWVSPQAAELQKQGYTLVM